MKVDPGLAGRLIELEAHFGAHDRRPLDMVFARADGVFLWDLQGNRYMDFLAGHSAVVQGHTHTRVAAALVEQSLRLATASGALRNDRLPPFLEKVCTTLGFEAALLLDSEAGALAAALRAARKWAVGCKGLEASMAEFLAFSGNGQPSPETDPPGFHRVPFGDLAATKANLGPRTCAILVEPVQDKDVRLPPKGFLKGLKALCEARGLLLLGDERRTGLGRTGRLSAFEHDGIRPDGLILGKALTGGCLPLGAFLASRELMEGFAPGPPVATFGGHPLACAVASAVLEVVVDDRLSDRSAELGAYFLARLRAMESPRIGAIRGLGLWAGLELLEGGTRDLCQALAHEGLLCEGTAENVITLAPPLVVTREHLDWALEKLERVLGRV